MKRRKNSSTSSSSMPGTCGTAPCARRTACVVLMLTTALPCSSTSRVKSGSSRACASTVALNAASHSAASPLTSCCIEVS
jgi:hypothetical protein